MTFKQLCEFLDDINPEGGKSAKQHLTNVVPELLESKGFLLGVMAVPENHKEAAIRIMVEGAHITERRELIVGSERIPIILEGGFIPREPL